MDERFQPTYPEAMIRACEAVIPGDECGATGYQFMKQVIRKIIPEIETRLNPDDGSGSAPLNCSTIPAIWHCMTYWLAVGREAGRSSDPNRQGWHEAAIREMPAEQLAAHIQELDQVARGGEAFTDSSGQLIDGHFANERLAVLCGYLGGIDPFPEDTGETLTRWHHDHLFGNLPRPRGRRGQSVNQAFMRARNLAIVECIRQLEAWGFPVGSEPYYPDNSAVVIVAAVFGLSAARVGKILLPT